MNPHTVHDFLIPACKALFPASFTAFGTPPAIAMLLAIGLQESDFEARRQLVGHNRNWWDSLTGPATSFWQFEKGGIQAILAHAKTGPILKDILTTLGYPDDADVIHDAITHNDILAVCCARLLLYTYPGPLPRPQDTTEAWRQYIWCWRPGKPTTERWPTRYRLAWDIVRGGI